MSTDSTYVDIGRRYTEGDTSPPLAIQYVDDDGNPINLTGYTVELRIDRPSTVLVKQGNITNAANGEVEFGSGVDPWVATDLVYGLAQVADLVFTLPTGERETNDPKLKIDVDRRIA